MRDVLQNTARKFKIYMADSAAPTSGKTGLSAFTVYLAKDGLAEATVAPSIIERGHGWYEVTPTTAHRDTLGCSAWTFVATGAIDFPRLENVIAADAQVAAWGANTVAPSNATIVLIYALLQLTDSDVAAIFAKLPITGYLAGAAASNGHAELDSATQAQLDAIEAVAAGTVSGAGTQTEIFVGSNVTVTVTVDADGNRSSVVVS